MLPTVFTCPCLTQSSTLFSFPHTVLFPREIFPIFMCALTLVKYLKTGLYKTLFSPFFIHKVHIYFNSALGLIKKMKGFLNTKKLYFYGSVEQPQHVWYCTMGKSRPPRGSGDGKAGQAQAPDRTRGLLSCFAPAFGAFVSTSHSVSWLISVFICMW